MESADGDPTNAGQPTSPERLSADTVRVLHDVHGRDLLTFLMGVLQDWDAACDVSQATFQRLLEVGHLTRTETVRGWLFKVAFHGAMAHRRKQARGDRLQRAFSTEVENRVEPDITLQSLVRDEEVARLRELLQQLPEEQQFVVRQRIQEEKTFAVIADELNVPLGTVLTRMRLAVQKLQKWLGRDNTNG